MGLPIGRPLVGAALQRLFKLQGRVALELEPFILPTVQIADMSRGEAPPLQQACSGTCSITGVVGQLSTAQLEIPGGMAAQLKRIIVHSGAAELLTIRWSGPGITLAGQAATGVMDGRLNNSQTVTEPAAVLTFGTQVAPISPIQWAARIDLDHQQKFDFEDAVVGNQEADQFGFLEIQGDTANTTLVLTLEWVEYALV